MQKESVRTIIEWHERTFPHATLDGQVAKFAEEHDEYLNAPRNNKLSELADLFIVACGIMRFSPWYGARAMEEVSQFAERHKKRNFEEAIDKKMAINRARVWACHNGMYHHETIDSLWEKLVDALFKRDKK